MAKCIKHPDVEAVAICASCGNSICEECSIRMKGKVYCTDCVEELMKAGAATESYGGGGFI
jgi:S-adenosylmethionine synthetase